MDRPPDTALLGDTVFCAIDFETTGINPAYHRVVEAGMVRFTRAGVIDRFQSLVNPGVPIPPDVTAIHGITDDAVAAAPPVESLLETMTCFIGDAVPVMHNPAFDLGFLGWEHHRAGRTMPPYRAFDTVTLARRAYPGLPNYRLETLAGRFGYGGSFHRAADDAMTCRELFTGILHLVDPGGSWTLRDLERFHGNPVRPPLIRHAPEAWWRGTRIVPGEEVTIRYRDSGGTVTERSVVPRSVVTYGREKYLSAQCRLRGEIRLFRLRRIEELRRTAGDR